MSQDPVVRTYLSVLHFKSLPCMEVSAVARPLARKISLRMGACSHVRIACGESFEYIIGAATSVNVPPL